MLGRGAVTCELQGLGREVRTEDDDIEDQDDEAQDATAGAILPRVASSGSRDVLRDGRGKGESSQAELEEEAEEVVEHLDS